MNDVRASRTDREGEAPVEPLTGAAEPRRSEVEGHRADSTLRAPAESDAPRNRKRGSEGDPGPDGAAGDPLTPRVPSEGASPQGEGDRAHKPLADTVASVDGRWPLVEAPEPLETLTLWNFYYLNTCPPPRDPTIVWGTDVDCTGLQTYLRTINAESPVLVTPAHVLVAATGRALATHPQFNRRILKRRVWRYRDVNVVMPFRPKSGLDVMFFGKVDAKSVAEIAGEAWRNAQSMAGEHEGVPLPAYMRFPRRLQAMLQPLHVWLVNHVNIPLRGTNNRQRAASTMVNYFGHRGMAPLRSFKPSRLPYDSITLSVTMGAIEPRPIAVGGEVAVRPIAPLFVRADHRIVDAHEIGAFAETLRGLIAEPAKIGP